MSDTDIQTPAEPRHKVERLPIDDNLAAGLDALTADGWELATGFPVMAQGLADIRPQPALLVVLRRKG